MAEDTRKPVTIFGSMRQMGERVFIDGDESIKAVVTAFCFRVERSATVEVSYFHDGKSVACWVEEWRLTPVVKEIGARLS